MKRELPITLASLLISPVLVGCGATAIVSDCDRLKVPNDQYLAECEAVAKYAPVLKFDQEYKGLPMSAQLYFDTMMARAVNPNEGTIQWSAGWDGPCRGAMVTGVPGRDESNCGMQNTNFQALRSGQVPTYFKAIVDGTTPGTGRLRVAYWWFYGFQQACNPVIGEPGEHHGDWEHILVTLSPDRSMIDAVTYSFHGSSYTRRAGGFETEQGRPVVYVGKLAHGSYHDRTFSGWMIGTPHHCCEYADYRNPGPDSIWTTTQSYLVSLDRNSQPWMLADRIGSLFRSDGKEYKISPWRWGPHISYKPCPPGLKWACKWVHESACGTHPTLESINWDLSSCEGVGCGEVTNCRGLVYTRRVTFDQGWPL